MVVRDWRFLPSTASVQGVLLLELSSDALSHHRVHAAIVHGSAHDRNVVLPGYASMAFEGVSLDRRFGPSTRSFTKYCPTPGSQIGGTRHENPAAAAQSGGGGAPGPCRRSRPPLVNQGDNRGSPTFPPSGYP